MKIQEEVKTDKAPKAVGPYSQAVKTDGLIFVSGQIGVDPKTNALVEGIENQIEQVLKNIIAILETAGVNLENVVRCDIYLKNIVDYAKVNEIYGKYFSKDPKPARLTIEASNLPKSALIEISCIASY